MSSEATCGLAKHDSCLRVLERKRSPDMLPLGTEICIRIAAAAPRLLQQPARREELCMRGRRQRRWRRCLLRRCAAKVWRCAGVAQVLVAGW